MMKRRRVTQARSLMFAVTGFANVQTLVGDRKTVTLVMSRRVLL